MHHANASPVLRDSGPREGSCIANIVRQRLTTTSCAIRGGHNTHKPRQSAGSESSAQALGPCRLAPITSKTRVGLGAWEEHAKRGGRRMLVGSSSGKLAQSTGRQRGAWKTCTTYERAGQAMLLAGRTHRQRRWAPMAQEIRKKRLRAQLSRQAWCPQSGESHNDCATAFASGGAVGEDQQ